MKTVLLSLVLLLAPVLVVQPGTRAEAVAAQPSPALAKLASCVRERRALTVLVLVDESSSLTGEQGTDPDDKRVRAAQVAVHGLSQLVDTKLTPPPPVKVDIALASFAHDFAAGPWRDLATTAQEIRTDLDGFAHRDQGQATDYVLALNRAREVLSARAAEATNAGGEAPCQALLWFTDGRYYPLSGSEEDTQRGKQELCAPNGVVDQLRGTGATLLTVALAKDMKQADEDFLRSITTGGCGATSSPAGGHYLSADGAAELIDAFADVIPRPNPPLPLCESPAQGCGFTLDPLLRSFYLLIHTGGAASEVSVRPPGGGALTLSRPGVDTWTAASGANLKWAWFDDTVVVTGELPSAAVGQWSGDWRVDGSGGGRIYLFGNLEQRIAGEPRFVRGEPWQFRTEITFDGKPASDIDLSSIDPKFTVTFADGADERPAEVTPVPGNNNAVDVSFDAPQSWHGSAVQVKVELKVATQQGIDISPVALTRTVPVATPLDLSPTKLLLPSVRGRGETTGTIKVTAADTGGCVSVGAARLDQLPVPITVSPTGSECLEVAPHTSRDVEVKFTVERGWAGTAQGVVPITLKVGDTDPVQVDVPVSFGLVAAPDQPKLLLVLGLLVLLTLAPLLVLLLANHLVVKRFHRPRMLRVGSLDVRVVPGDGPVPVRVEPIGHAFDWPDTDDITPLYTPPKRTFSRGTVTFTARCSPWNPFATPRTQVRAASGHVVATATDGPAQTLDELPLNLPGVVVVSAEAERGEVFMAEIVFVLGEEPLRAGEVRNAVEAAAKRLLPVRQPTEHLL